MPERKTPSTLVEYLKGKSGSQGFTLMELLIIVVILGILVAIALPIYLGQSRGADKRTAEYNLKIGERCIDAL